VTAATSLNRGRRAAELAAMAAGEVVDVLVVGGGVTGAGVALDAASRGLSVCLIEAHDIAFGTSRWSSKLVHGGLRYLAKGEVGLAYESAVERGVLMTRTAPHLVRALPQLVALHDSGRRLTEASIMTGLRAGDVMRRIARTPGTVLPGPRRVRAREALALSPGLRRHGLRGGLLSFDGQLVDDARLVLAVARTAAGLGAKVLTRVRATALAGDGAEVRDEVTGTGFGMRARTVVNSTGVWAGQLVPSVRLRPSRGSHLVLDAATVGLTSTALTVPVPGEGNRFVLLLPQHDGRVYVGLTDEAVELPVPDVPEIPPSDVDFLLDVASTVLERPLRTTDVLGTYAGLRPLVETGPGKAVAHSADLSRRHAILVSADGVVTVVGGKLTTYRRMASDAVDAVVRRGGLAARPSRTARLPLVGAAPREAPLAMDVPRRLAAKYGTEASKVLALGMPEVISAATGTTAAEVVWAVRHEGALNADDVLDRRTRIGLVEADRAAALPRVTALVEQTLE